jgi:hypothetical protein
VRTDSVTLCVSPDQQAEQDDREHVPAPAHRVPCDAHSRTTLRP